MGSRKTHASLSLPVGYILVFLFNLWIFQIQYLIKRNSKVKLKIKLKWKKRLLWITKDELHMGVFPIENPTTNYLMTRGISFCYYERKNKDTSDKTWVRK